MNYLRNEQGITLTELLAALFISGMVLGGAMMALHAVHQWVQHSAQGSLERSERNRVMNVYATQLADSTSAVYFAASEQLRFKYMGKIYRSMIFDPAGSRLMLYDFFGNEEQFYDGAVTPETHPSLYGKALILTDQAAAVQYSRRDGKALDIPLEHGEWFSVTVTFQNRSSAVTRSISVKLLADQTLK